MSSPIENVFEQMLRLTLAHMERQGQGQDPVVRYLAPEELTRELDLTLPEEGRPFECLLEETRRVLRYSVQTGHPRFFNQLFGGCEPAAVMGDWVASLTNASMYTFESAPVMTLMEQAIIARLNRLVGFEEGEGVLAPGGSLSNLMAVLAARHRAFPEVKHEGLPAGLRPVMFASAEAHYSLRRAASVAGLGTRGCVEVPTDSLGRMRPRELERLIIEAQRAGWRPFMVAATAGTTVAGAFDPLEDIADAAQRHGLWMHVDASYGGTVLFSEARRHLVAGIERADSVAWNPHKMMGVPLSCSATLTREPGHLRAALGMGADYLFHEDSSAWDLGDMTLQCGRRVDVLKLWYAWQVTGDRGYARRVERLFELAGELTTLIEAREGFELVREPTGTNVCFRYLNQGDRDARGEQRLHLEHETTLRARGRLVEGGEAMVNYATLDGAATFRFVANNPDAQGEDLTALLDSIERCAEEEVCANGTANGLTPCDSEPSEEATGSYFISTYPPFSTWNAAGLDVCRAALETPPLEAAPLGLYAHIPFCLERCRYCYYLSHANPGQDQVDRYVGALLAELESHARTPALEGRELEYAYIGGGTPSMLGPEQIRRLLSGLQAGFPARPERELTFECAPRSALPERLEAMGEGGVTRVSMGVQAMDDDLLWRNGRIHLVQDVERAYRAIREVGFEVVNLDLMVGLVGETEELFLRSLERTIELEPDSITLYQLEIPHNTPLFRALGRGQLRGELPSWETKHRRLGLAFERLGRAGYQQRSAYGAVRDPDRHRFVYQDTQYRGGDLLGVGVSAFSYLRGVHHQNECSLERYLEMVDGGELPAARAHLLNAEEQLVREFILQLKLGHISREDFRRRFDVEVLGAFAEPLEVCAREGWIEFSWEVDDVVVTRDGLTRVDRFAPSFYLARHRGLQYS
jgi:coproporphyrinogen III oxidase-like Fe-S oxidoreductase/glutamate/tyrosine decarboxylase-like PLP-dependent enzyme